MCLGGKYAKDKKSVYGRVQTGSGEAASLRCGSESIGLLKGISSPSNAQDSKGNGNERTEYQRPIQISEKGAAVHVALIGVLLRHERCEVRNEIGG